MFSRPSRRGRLLAAALALLATDAAVARSLIVQSAGPAAARYAPGHFVEDTTPVVLGPADQVTLLAARGTWTLHGPGRFTGAPVVPGTAASIGRLLRPSGASDAVIGGIRSISSADAALPSVWAIDIRRAGRQCVPAGQAIMLWRPDSLSTRVTVRDAAGHSGSQIWSAGSAAAAWPKEVPVASEASYVATTEVGSRSWTLVVVDLPAGELVDAAAMLVANGCTQQLQYLIDKTANGDVYDQ